jgi:hypothetical protein
MGEFKVVARRREEHIISLGLYRLTRKVLMDFSEKLHNRK